MKINDDGYYGSMSDEDINRIVKIWNELDEFLKNGKVIDNIKGVKDIIEERKVKKDFNFNLLFSDVNDNNFDDDKYFVELVKNRCGDITDDEDFFNKIVVFMRNMRTGLEVVKKKNNGEVSDKDFLFVLTTMLIFAEDVGIIKINTKKYK